MATDISNGFSEPINSIKISSLTRPMENIKKMTVFARTNLLKEILSEYGKEYELYNIAIYSCKECEKTGSEINGRFSPCKFFVCKDCTDTFCKKCTKVKMICNDKCKNCRETQEYREYQYIREIFR